MADELAFYDDDSKDMFGPRFKLMIDGLHRGDFLNFFYSNTIISEAGKVNR